MGEGAAITVDPWSHLVWIFHPTDSGFRPERLSPKTRKVVESSSIEDISGSLAEPFVQTRSAVFIAPGIVALLVRDERSPRQPDPQFRSDFPRIFLVQVHLILSDLRTGRSVRLSSLWSRGGMDESDQQPNHLAAIPALSLIAVEWESTLRIYDCSDALRRLAASATSTQ